MQAKIYHLGGEELQTVNLPEEIFAEKENKPLLAEAVKVYLGNQRRARAKAKTRGEVSGSGKKIWRQKGTGRARHGDRYAPIFVGGGVAHGPTGRENWQRSFPQKKKEKALKVALSQKLSKGELFFIDSFAAAGNKTGKANRLLEELLKKATEFKMSKVWPKTALVFAGKDKEVILPFRNIPWLKILRIEDLNTYAVLDNKFLILEKGILEELKKRMGIKIVKRRVKHA